MGTIKDLQEHLQYWDPPDEILTVFRHFAQIEEHASFEKLEGQEVYRCNDPGLDAAIEPLLRKLRLETANKHLRLYHIGC